jgi:hypothetical protein
MNAAIPLLASAFLFLALSSTPVTAWLDCTPGCNSGYSIQSTDCSSNPSTCISTCHRPLSCGDWIDEIDGYDEDSDYNDNTVELDFNIDPQAFEDKGRCHATSST